jgi:hypothetical protein
MTKNIVRIITYAASVILLGLSSYAVSDDNQQTARPLAVNQTEGYGDGQLLVFTYFQNFACIHWMRANFNVPSVTLDALLPLIRQAVLSRKP